MGCRWCRRIAPHRRCIGDASPCGGASSASSRVAHQLTSSLGYYQDRVDWGVADFMEPCDSRQVTHNPATGLLL
eukprot:3657417-Pyramimonas_sp.AAC.1